MDAKILEIAKEWATNPVFNEETRNEIQTLIDTNNESELTDRFYKGLEFGTGGMRGVLGAGTNRLNVYTVGKATQGLAEYICKLGQEAKDKGVVIACDSRNFSDVFSKQAAMIFAGNGVKAYLFESLRPLPEMSFGVRLHGATAGIMITASHNPPKYNGYKVSWSDGCQVTPPHDKGIIDTIEEVANYAEAIKVADYDEAIKSGLIQIIGEETDAKYYDALEKRIVNKELVATVAEDLNIVYTSIHGAGIKLIPTMLKNLGIKNVHIVKEQEVPDGNFPTVVSPNPENGDALAMGIELAKKTNSTIVLATDPDTDRLGIAVKTDDGGYELFNGNQLGSIMCYYILSQMKEQGKLTPDKHIVKTIVTTDLAFKIAEAFGVKHKEVLTGFKYIGEVIAQFEKEGDAEKFIFGYEESYGFLQGTDVRDKDAVIAVQLTVECAAWAQSKGMTLSGLLDEVYEKFGYFKESLKSYTFEGYEGVQKIKAIMKGMREDMPSVLNGQKVVDKTDILVGKKYDGEGNVIEDLTLPTSDVLMFTLEDMTKIAIRPSGTEPKIKFYFSVRRPSDGDLSATKAEVASIIENLTASIDELVSKY